MPERATTTLGRTGLQVARLGYGAIPVGSPRLTERESGRLLNGVLDAGINLIDTAPDYGMSEERIGRSIAGRRSEFVLTTKCGCLPGPSSSGLDEHDFRRENLVRVLEQSLLRLKTDYVDVLQFHIEPTAQTLEQAGALETLAEFKRQGKVRFVGMSAGLPRLAMHVEMGVFDVFQVPYSALQRDAEDVITKAGLAGCGILVRGRLRYAAPETGPSSLPTGVRRVPHRLEAPEMLERWERAGLDDLLDGMTRMAFMLRFTLSHPYVHTSIVGTGNLGHLHDNVTAASEGPLPDIVYREAKHRLTAAGIRAVGSADWSKVDDPWAALGH
jgi:aryl-alcohol dehydrogenase-like predicted oxidoreductase